MAKRSLEGQIKSFLKAHNKVSQPASSSKIPNPNPNSPLLPRSSLVDILIKHQSIFGIENQAKRMLKDQQISNSSREKQLEHQRKLSLFIDNPAIEPLSASKRSLIDGPFFQKPPLKERPMTKEECFELTNKTNKMVSERVNDEFVDSGRMIEDLLGDIVPGKRKIKERRLEVGLRAKPMEEMRRKHQELGLTTGQAEGLKE